MNTMRITTMVSNALHGPELSSPFSGGRKWKFRLRSHLIPLLWLISLFLLIATLIPGVDLALGNLPGDVSIARGDHAIYIPLGTSGLVTVVIGGLFYLASNYLTRR
jgi:hypothetical protein